MKEVNGKFNAAKVFTDVVDDSAISQIKLLCNQQFVSGSKIRIMPDCHAGAGCTIGTTMTIMDKVVPNLVGVDIGCGMEVVKILQKDIDFKKLDALIHQKIPAGFNIRETPHKYNNDINLSELRCLVDGKLNLVRAERSLGTLGGGNHFIEADKDCDGNIYIVIHSGSRHLGLEVANFYQEQGWKSLNGRGKSDIATLISEFKSAGRQREIQSAIAALKNKVQTGIPKQLAYVSGTNFDDYIHDMKITQKFAMLNRKAMMDVIISGMGFAVSEQFTTIHNYIDTENMILRKGAVSAKKGEKLIIPINMRDGSLICIGKGNDDWNKSAPHGAGRLMSRTEAKHKYTVDEYEKQMQGIYTTSVNGDTLDECPMAYKTMDDIVDNIGDTASILQIVKPVYNFKAGLE